MLLKIIDGGIKVSKLFNRQVEYLNDLTVEEQKLLYQENEKNNLGVKAEFIFENDEDEYIFLTGEDFEFLYQDLLKKMYMVQVCKIDITEYKKRKIFNNIVHFEEVERRLEKSLIDFTDDDVEESIRYFSKAKRNKHTTIMEKCMAVNLIREIFGIKLKANWNISLNYISKIMGEISNVTKIITKESLDEMFWNMPNPQTSIIPILIFEGVVSSSNTEIDELRSLKSEDVLDTGVFVESKKYGRRFIPMDEDVIHKIRVADKQKRLIVSNDGRSLIEDKVEFVQTPYVLKIIELAANRNKDGKISFPGLRRRLVEEFQSEFEKQYGISNVGVRILRDCGKIHYCKKYMLEGLPFKPAAIKTLERYQEYELYNIGKTVAAMEHSNNSKYFRFKNTWEAYNANRNWRGDKPKSRQ